MLVHELILELAKVNPTLEVSIYINLDNKVGCLSGIVDITSVEEDGNNIYIQSEAKRNVYIK